MGRLFFSRCLFSSPSAGEPDLIEFPALSVHLLVNYREPLFFELNHNGFNRVGYAEMDYLDGLVNCYYRAAGAGIAVKHPADASRIDEMNLADLLVKRRMAVADCYYALLMSGGDLPEPFFGGICKEEFIRVIGAAMVHAERDRLQGRPAIFVQFERAKERLVLQPAPVVRAQFSSSPAVHDALFGFPGFGESIASQQGVYEAVRIAKDGKRTIFTYPVYRFVWKRPVYRGITAVENQIKGAAEVLGYSQERRVVAVDV